jgi:hypothetical protein
MISWTAFSLALIGFSGAAGLCLLASLFGNIPLMTRHYTFVDMRRAAAVVISAWLGLCAPAQAALAGVPAAMPVAASDVAAFNLKAQPLPKPYEGLLSKNKYDLRADGTVWSPDGTVAVSQAEMPFLLHRLESAQRLKALLQLDMLLSNSDGEKYLTPVERENLRNIVRENWPFFTLGTRKDFRHFFSLQELEGMNRDPAPTDSATALTMSDPEPQDYSESELPPALKPVPMPRLLPAPLPPQPVYADGQEPGPAPSPALGVAPAVYYVASVPGASGAPGAALIAAALPAPGALPLAAAPPLMPAALAPAPAAVAPAPAPAAVTPAPAPASAPASPAPAPAPAGAAAATPPPPTAAALAAAANSAAFPPGMVAVAPSGPASRLAPAAAVAPGAPEAPVSLASKATSALPPPAAVAAVPAVPAAAAPAPVTPAQAAAPAPAAPGPFVPAPIQAQAVAGAGPPARVAPAPQPPPAPAPQVTAPLPPTQPVAEAGLPPVRLIPADAFERFLNDAPYGHDAKSLLRLISQKAMEPSRSRALGAVMNGLPQIVFDTARAGLDAHAALLAIETPEMHAYTIAVSPGPIYFQKKRLFGAGPMVMLADSAKIYASLHAPMPAVEALKRDAPAVKVQEGPYGAERLYSDDSRRGAYSQQQMAGYLLRKLLRLDAKRGGWDASAYAAEAYARSAQWIFYARVMLDTKNDSFLDPETRASFRQWRDQPEEYRDHLIHTLSAGRVQTLDPRKGSAETQAEFDRAAAQGGDCPAVFKADIQARLDADREALKKDALALSRAGLLEDEQLDNARKAIDADFAAVRLPVPTAQQCAARYAAEAAQLRSSAALFAEMGQSERAFRGDDAAPGAGQ